MATALKSSALSVIVISVLVLFMLSSVSAKTYEVVSIGAIHQDEHYQILVTPLYGTDVVNDTANGILKFTVTMNLDGYTQVLGASNSTSDISKTPNNMPVFEMLQVGDIIQIDFKNCQYSQLSIQKIPSTNNYMILYSGQANSVQINSTAIPEFPQLYCFATVLAILMVFEVLIIRKRSSQKNP